MAEQESNSSLHTSSGSLHNGLHNGPTSIWVPEEGTSTIDSTLRGIDETTSTNNTSTLSLSLGSAGFSGWQSSSESDLNFSKRLSSDLSDEARQQALKPSSFHKSKSNTERIFPISSLKFSALGLVGRDDEKELLKMCLKRAKPPSEGQSGSREMVLISGTAGTGKIPSGMIRSISPRTRSSNFYLH